MRWVIFFFFVHFLSFSFGQSPNEEKIDSLQRVVKSVKDKRVKAEIYNEISSLFLYSNFTEGHKYAQKALSVSRNIQWESGMALAYVNIAKHQISRGNLTKSIPFLKKAEFIFKETKDDNNLGQVYNQFGILKANQGKFPEALDYFFMSLNFFEKTNDPANRLNIANLYQNIGNIYSASENDEKAIVNYNKAIALFKKISSSETSVAMNIASKGMVFQKQKKYKEALFALKTAEKILVKNNEKIPLAFVSSWLGSTYLAMGKYSESLSYSNQSLQTLQAIGDQVLTASTFQNIGYAYLKKGMADKEEKMVILGFENLSKSLQMNKSSGNLELLQNDYKYLSEYYEFKKDYKKSLEEHKNYLSCNESIFNTKNKQTLQNLEDERTIQLNKKQILVGKINLEKKEKQKWFLISGLAFLSIIGTLLYYQNQSKKKNNKKLVRLNADLDAANKAKARFFSILNHDLRSPVANLAWFLQMQKDNPEMMDEESKLRIQDKTIQGVENLLISMEDILQWSKSQMENFKPQPTRFMAERIFEDLKIHFSSVDKAELHFDIPSNLQIYTDGNYLKTILRNLTGNAIKAIEGIENPRIEWKAWQENGSTYFSILDNGKGVAHEQLNALYDEKFSIKGTSGLGLYLIRDLAKAIHCSVELDTSINVGTRFMLELKTESKTS